MITAVVVDDEPLAREELKYLLEETERVEVIGEADSGEELFEVLRDRKPDVVFLDIEMYGLNGLDVALELLKEKDPPLIVFATAYDQYAVKAFELNALDYLLKPFSAERVKLTLEKIEEKLRDKEIYKQKMWQSIQAIAPQQKVFIQTADKILPLKREEIYFVEAQGRYARLRLKNKWVMCRHSLSELEDMLGEKNFVKVHKSFLVNFEQIKEIIPLFGGGLILRMGDDGASEVPVGRTFLKSFKEKIGLNI
ncbi:MULTISPECIES: LytR/AlgR family response regulator transcription factor [Carboxydothermus]|uniref:Stage 0 sporulation protein A homolog n=2 Tax=Carboxydothermus TaxID=129957 RepID=Q3AA03_CARHZ|nr:MULTISPECIES: LytTR family DNA-binding domain-containing protein [Carboxydothermus]ABB15542.1 DNA-binding response regulator [Carboxydothermus hydrogenoformans Z-2901]NYE58022.1 two-component system LytT family response regulator/two-component system response regulator LytT [Carboxydothermus ferrireducens DSM 11255]